LTSKGIPQLHIDQLSPKFILNLEHLVKQPIPMIQSGGVFQYSFNKLTRGKLVKQDDWTDWQESEWKQLDQYYAQLMFGKPTFVKDRSQVFHLVWTYMVKDVDKRKKARCACDGSTRGGKVRVLDYTHANCVDHTASRIFYGIAAAENHMVYRADVCNAFSEAPPPKQGFYIQPDRAFHEWWAARGREPIPEGYVIPVMRAMQGHQESSRLWEKHCDKIVKKLGFKPTVHEPCLYEGSIDGERCIFKRQVDDFALATNRPETAHKFFDLFDDELTMPMKRMGLIQLFNGVDILQSRYYIKMSCETYIEKMSVRHIENWMTDAHLRDMANRPLPIPTGETFMKQFTTIPGDPDQKEQEKLAKEFKFQYRSGIGELIYAMVTCRPDISTTVVKCAQHSACPNRYHYHAVRHALKYLYITRKDGIYFWRAQPLMDLPEHPLLENNSALHGTLPEGTVRPEHDPLDPHAYTDSDWASCLKTRRSTTGIIVRLAGGVIAYKTKLQVTVAMSSTEAEFMAACDAGKMILFIRSILWDLGVPQQAATVIYEDNDACTAMANAKKPTTRTSTRHMDIRYFALSDWVEMDLMRLE
jgi:KUP system potassium uptake protein